MKISEIKDGTKDAAPFLIKQVDNGTTNKGAAYLSLVLQDSSGSINAKFWNVNDEDKRICVVGKVVMFNYEGLDYKNALQLRINGAHEMNQDEVKMSDFVISSSYPEDKRKEDFNKLYDLIENTTYKKIIKAMLKKVGNKYMEYPAASKIHHNWLGGLSEHSISMAQMAVDVCKHYPQLNRDILITGALLHDIGKTAEMSGPVTTEYTLQGKLEGHISIANGWLTEVCTELGVEESEEAILLHHMILAHHGHYEYGSPVLPLTQEAEVLSIIDNLDARLNTIKQAMANIEPGNWTSKLFALDNRQFYKPKGE